MHQGGIVEGGGQGQGQGGGEWGGNEKTTGSVRVGKKWTSHHHVAEIERTIQGSRVVSFVPMVCDALKEGLMVTISGRACCGQLAQVENSTTSSIAISNDNSIAMSDSITNSIRNGDSIADCINDNVRNADICTDTDERIASTSSSTSSLSSSLSSPMIITGNTEKDVTTVFNQTTSTKEHTHTQTNTNIHHDTHNDPNDTHNNEDIHYDIHNSIFVYTNHSQDTLDVSSVIGTSNLIMRYEELSINECESYITMAVALDNVEHVAYLAVITLKLILQ